MIPARFAPVLFALILSGFMSFMVSGIATYRALGLVENFGALWIAAWIPSWMIACPAAFFFGPIARRIVAKLVRAE